MSQPRLTCPPLLLSLGFLWLNVGCSLILDAENLRVDPDDTGTVDTGPAEPCTVNADCVDDVECTGDVCGEEDSCLHLPDNNLCPELHYCDAQEGCVPSGDECGSDGGCDDGVDCTRDSCVYGQCHFTPDDAYCADPSLLCIEGATCDTIDGCIEGTERPCNQPDGICRDARCNPDNGECEEGWMPGADDDADLSLDATCGGDDCDDGDDTVLPGGTEFCDSKDNDCDTFDDVTFSGDIVDVVTADISNPAFASNGNFVAALWQQGTGTSRDTWVRIYDQSGSPVDAALRLNLLPGSTPGASGVSAGITAVGSTFYAIWSTVPSSGPLALQIVPIDATASKMTAGDPVDIELEVGVDKVVSPVIAADMDRAAPSWVLAFGTRTGADSDVFLKTPEMVAPMNIESRSATVSAVALAPLSTGSGRDYAVTWAMDKRIRESRVVYTTDWVVDTGYPANVSNAGVESSDPTVIENGSGSRVIAWKEKNITTLATGISFSDDGGVSYLVNPSTREPSRAFLGAGSETRVLVYIKDISASAADRSATLIFEQYRPSLSMPDDQLAQTRLLTVHNNDGSWISSPYMAAVSEQFFVVGWLRTDSAVTTLQYGIATACRL